MRSGNRMTPKFVAALLIAGVTLIGSVARSTRAQDGTKASPPPAVDPAILTSAPPFDLPHEPTVGSAIEDSETLKSSYSRVQFEPPPAAGRTSPGRPGQRRPREERPGLRRAEPQDGAGRTQEPEGGGRAAPHAAWQGRSGDPTLGALGRGRSMKREASCIRDRDPRDRVEHPQSAARWSDAGIEEKKIAVMRLESPGGAGARTKQFADSPEGAGCRNRPIAPSGTRSGTALNDSAVRDAQGLELLAPPETAPALFTPPGHSTVATASLPRAGPRRSGTAGRTR